MKRLLLIHGEPRSGKSSLARKLQDEHSFEVLSLDELYVKFIETECEDFYFKNLRTYISPHYHYILDARGYTKKKYGRDLVHEWHEYIFTTSFNMSAEHDNLAIEGYLLFDCLGALETRVSQIAQVFIVHVSDFSYRVLGAPLTVDDIAALGQTDGHSSPNPPADNIL